MTLTIKNYKEAKGLSSRIHEQNEGDVFLVSGPMGQGLDVDLSGVNVAFAAGTGVLPFIDLVGYLARSHLGVTGVDSTSPSDGFFFWLNVRMGAHEAIADELMTRLGNAIPGQFRYDAVKKDRSM